MGKRCFSRFERFSYVPTRSRLITHYRNKDAAQDTIASSKLVLVQRRFSRVVIEGKNADGSSLARQNAKLENNQKSIEENNL
jgi:hypothetical protein